MTTMMRAAVADQPGLPEVLTVREVPRPKARDGWTLVEVKGFGLNRSELMTRQGHSPNVRFPRVLGIECVGVVAESTDPQFEPVGMIPSGTRLTAFHSEDLAGAAGASALQNIVDGVAQGAYKANLDRVFRLDEIVEAHRYMEASRATGKVVVLP
jgi:NADPH:quinone reductase-like Zn-dependent oxidoreductase